MASTASIWQGKSCIRCGWPIIHACCNDEMGVTPPYIHWDWWVYCSNKGCEHHEGEGVFQDTPEWMK